MISIVETKEQWEWDPVLLKNIMKWMNHKIYKDTSLPR